MNPTFFPAILLLGALAVAAPSGAQNAPTPKLPANAKAVELRPARSWNAFTVSSPDGKIEVVPGNDARFDTVLRASNTRLPDRDYDIQAVAPTETAIKKGDVLLAQFWMRTIVTTDETGQGTVGFVFERAGEPYTKSGTYAAHAGDKWQQFQVPFTAAEDYQPGGAHILFRLGYRPQTVEIAGFTLSNYGQTVKLADLPRTKFSYAGQQLDAPWRREAATAIDRLRKADLNVRVVDGKGQPVAGASVRVEMTDAAYKFGSAISERILLGNDATPADKAKYAQIYRGNFNFAVIENGLKWPQWNDLERRQKTLFTAGWLQGNQIPLRGHVLVWPSWANSPKELEAFKDDKDKLRQTILDHIKDEASAMRGAVTQWDVINETFTNHDLMDVLGRDAMIDWFKAARTADPNARLYINDYAILNGGARDTDHQKDYEQTIKFLIDGGAPIGGIGMQGHMGDSYTPPVELWKVLDRFGKFGLPITVTEFDIASDDEAAQADYMRDFMTAMFAHPATDGVMMWGFWEGRHWKPGAALWRRDWTLKPAGAAWRKLVKDEWTTRAAGVADKQGAYKVRGFKGKYRVWAQQGARVVSATAQLDKNGDGVTLVLP